MNKLIVLVTFYAVSFFTNSLKSQTTDCEFSDDKKDSIFLNEVENQPLTKVLHAEPLYIDLIRDLGARKGEKEWNVAMGLTDKTLFDQYTALIEYEFAPINRLGFEIEIPFTFNSPIQENTNTPANKLNSIKLASQYSFFVSDKHNTTMAIGYIHEFELTDFKHSKAMSYYGNIFNPFFVAAKRWTDNLHSLIYSGPQIFQSLYNSEKLVKYQINTNFHYMISGTRNFVGIEINKEYFNNQWDFVLRPQMRLSIAENLILGIVTGIPIKKDQERMSTFFRFIYEPGHKHL